MNQTNDGNVFAICRERGWNVQDVLDFRSHVNPLGHPEGVGHAVREAIGRIVRYPESDAPELSAALAAHWGLTGPAGVLTGNGGTELLHFFSRAAWTGPTALVSPSSAGQLRAFPSAMRVPLGDPERWPQRGLLVISQPAQPTGEALAPELIKRVVASREGPVLVDESHIDFTDLPSAVAWCADHPNLIVLRSLTRFYGFPGLRVGALVAGEEWMTRLRRRREPWQLSVLAEAAALAALADREFAARSKELIAAERAYLRDQVEEWPGVELADSAGNFLFAAVNRPAEEVGQWFLDRKILIRWYSKVLGLPNEAIGFSIRTRAENEQFAAAGRELFCAA